MILAYSSYSKLVYNVNTGHMTLIFEIFCRETVLQVWSGNIHTCAEASDIEICMWIQLCIGHTDV